MVMGKKTHFKHCFTLHKCFTEVSLKVSESQLTSATDLCTDVELFTVTKLLVSFDPALKAEYGDSKSRENLH